MLHGVPQPGPGRVTPLLDLPMIDLPEHRPDPVHLQRVQRQVAEVDPRLSPAPRAAWIALLVWKRALSSIITRGLSTTAGPTAVFRLVWRTPPASGMTGRPGNAPGTHHEALFAGSEGASLG